MRLGVVALPGLAGAEAARALAAATLAGAEVVLVDGVDAAACAEVLLLTGEPGAAAAETLAAPLLGALAALVERGAPLLAAGEGFRLACAAGLLAGEVVVVADPAADPVAAAAHARVEGRPTPFTAALPAGRALHLPGAARLRYLAPVEAVATLEQDGRVVLRASSAMGELPAAPALVGVACPRRRLVGVTAPLAAKGDSRRLLLSALAVARGTPARV